MVVVAGRWILFIPVTMTTRYFTPTTRRKWTRPQSAAQPSIKSSTALYYSYSSEADTQPVCCRHRRYPNKPVGSECAEEQHNFWQTDKSYFWEVVKRVSGYYWLLTVATEFHQTRWNAARMPRTSVLTNKKTA